MYDLRCQSLSEMAYETRVIRHVLLDPLRSESAFELLLKKLCSDIDSHLILIRTCVSGRLGGWMRININPKTTLAFCVSKQRVEFLTKHVQLSVEVSERLITCFHVAQQT